MTTLLNPDAAHGAAKIRQPCGVNRSERASSIPYSSIATLADSLHLPPNRHDPARIVTRQSRRQNYSPAKIMLA
ncbi:hypothetical protein [Burkholderia sp. WSM2232]|uniref:hypothetical protein n=1 Tax=Burkholderia sp. WSM2232 TaxID=944436 RepID=UPI0012EB2A37|nr:hypothetical protein [Burkholderia sp. WSM2232]